MNNNPVSETNLWIVHSSITIVLVGVCFIYLLLFDGFLEIGNVWKSPAIPLLIASELIKWFVNSKCFKLVALPKHIIIGRYRREPGMIDSIKTFFSTIFTLVVFFCAYVFTCIIFGASITEHLPGTICLSIILVTLTVLPFVLYLGGRPTWELLFCDQFELTSTGQIVYMDYVQKNAMACLFGAWISSIAAPLDWDRDWQTYPITNVCGAILGVTLSNIYWLINGIGKHYANKRQGTERQKSN